MLENKNTLAEGFIVKYDREDHSIDANTLINSLLHITTVMQEIAKFIQPEQELKINIKANAPGSFLVEFEIIKIFTIAQGLWHEYGGMIKDGGTVLAILNGLIQLKKHLNGRQPKQIVATKNSTTIINAENVSITIENPVFALYKDSPVIDKALSKHFETLEEDKTVTGFELLTPQKQPVLIIPREEFGSLAPETESVDSKAQIVIAEGVSVSISKLIWDQTKKWDFIYAGNKISAKITDPFFNGKIEASEIRFAKGDRMLVNLKITQVWDEEYHAFINKSYEIIEVLEFYKAPTQEKLDFGKQM